MLNYNEIKERKIIIFNDEPCEVISSHVFRKQQRKPVNQTKLKNLNTGKAIEHSFHVSDKAEEADLSKKKVIFLYEAKGEYWFHEDGDKSARFTLTAKEIGDDTIKFLKANFPAELLIFEYNDEEKVIGVELPMKMEFIVKEAPPSIKGNTATGGDKLVTLENGTKLTVPLFIEAGENILVNTSKGEYLERAK
ncbi:elongation factor P [Candidatus Parcubacteria bacterium]|nr:elongation factor P [Candidatus Parcubacteria bacterium]